MTYEEAGEDLARYVLGGLDPGKEHPVRSHLATCRACREALAGYAPPFDDAVRSCRGGR